MGRCGGGKAKGADFTGRDWRKKAFFAERVWALTKGLKREREKKQPRGCGAVSSVGSCSVHLGVQLAAGVALVHVFQGDRLDPGGMTGGAEGLVAGDADVAHGLDGLGEELARVELAGVLRSEEHTSELQSRPHLVCRL